jgi:hypothetical protein
LNELDRNDVGWTNRIKEWPEGSGLKEVDLKGRGFSRDRPEPKKVRALALRAALNHSKEDE